MKQCTKCKRWKDESEFYKDKRSKNGLVSSCKKCEKIKDKKQYENNKKEMSERDKKYYEAHKEEISERKREYANSPLPYDSDSKMRQELEWYEEVRESENGNTACKCAYEGDWFEPTKRQIKNRMDAINGEGTEGAENRLYCSETCKQSCPIYHKHWYERGYEPTTSREVQSALRKMVFARDNYICIACGWYKDDLIKFGISLHCHHEEGVQWNPLESADMDKCETRCAVCHKKIHQIPGFTYNDLKCPPHLKYNTGEK